MTSATERIRAMLDERGVEYRIDDAKTVRVTKWEFGEHSSAMFTEYDDGECVFVTSGHTWTPEQAIAATLGRSNVGRYVGLRRGEYWERTENSDYYCGGCGWKVTDHDSYCPECGGALHKVVEPTTNDVDGEVDE